ncbi:MAG: YqgE/AlgH family protein [Bacteroidota bacterium]
MHDTNFQRSVVLLVEHNEQGSLGFVMNRRLKVQINEVVEGIPDFEAPVFIGGPVEQSTLHFVHKLGDRLDGSHQVSKGLYWAGDFDKLREMILKGEVSSDEILFFVGYSGWGPGQLDTELDRKSWIIAPENAEFVFQNDYSDLWRQVLQEMGDKYKVISNYPVDPRMN